MVFFLIRDIDGPAMTAASDGILSIRGPEVPLGSLGVGIVVCNRLRRLRRRFHQWTAIKQMVPAFNQHWPMSAKVFDLEALWRSPKHQRMRCRGLPDPRPIPERESESRSASEKSK